jgi:hypothetical protein
VHSNDERALRLWRPCELATVPRGFGLPMRSGELCRSYHAQGWDMPGQTGLKLAVGRRVRRGPFASLIPTGRIAAERRACLLMPLRSAVTILGWSASQWSPGANASVTLHESETRQGLARCSCYVVPMYSLRASGQGRSRCMLISSGRRSRSPAVELWIGPGEPDPGTLDEGGPGGRT